MPRLASVPIPDFVPVTVDDPAVRVPHSAAFVASVRHNFTLVCRNLIHLILFYLILNFLKDTVTRCGATVTLNNTYWTSPTTLSAESTCSLAVKMDSTLPEQKRNPICQVRWVYNWLVPPGKRKFIQSNCYRLDFEAFSIAGPNTQTVCSTDNFRVSGTANKVPIICGQNVGQHSKLIDILFIIIIQIIEWFDLFYCVIVYLIAPSSTSDIQLIFTLGTGTSQDRNWKIRISLLACSSTSLLGSTIQFNNPISWNIDLFLCY